MVEFTNQGVMSEAGARANGAWAAMGMSTPPVVMPAAAPRREADTAPPRRAQGQTEAFTHCRADGVIWDPEGELGGAPQQCRPGPPTAVGVEARSGFGAGTSKPRITVTGADRARHGGLDIRDGGP